MSKKKQTSFREGTLPFGEERCSCIHYRYFDPIEHGYQERKPYPLLIFAQGDSEDIARAYSSPVFQTDFLGAYILLPAVDERLRQDVSAFFRQIQELIRDFSSSRTGCIGKTFLFLPSAVISAIRGSEDLFSGYFDALIPVGAAVSSDTLQILSDQNIRVFRTVDPAAALANLMSEDRVPMDQRFPRGLTGWIDEVNRDGCAQEREYLSRSGMIRSGSVPVEEHISLYYEEYGSGDRIILSAQCGFYHRGMHQRMADLGYHVYCITLRGFHPSSLVREDYGDRWYDVFASDVIAFADRMGINRFSYMGASHGAGVGWHLMLLAQERIDAFVAMVPGPHSLAEGTMSYRQMLEQGIIQSPPPFDPPVDSDPARQQRREYREKWISGGPRAFEQERKLDYGRPMMRFGSEEKLCEALRSITVPVLMIGGYDDPISTPALMMRTAGCLPHCKWIVYTNCGHNIDTDLIEEVSDEADRFISNVLITGKAYLPPEA